MSNTDAVLLDAAFFVVVSGSMYSFAKMVWSLLDFLHRFNFKAKFKEWVKVNIFDVKDKPLNTGLDSNTVGQGCPIFPTNDDGVRAWENYQSSLRNGPDNQVIAPSYGVVSDGSVEAAVESNHRVHVDSEKYKNSQVATFFALQDEEGMRWGMDALLRVLSSDENSDDIKWQSINSAYCQLSVAKEKIKAELIRTYFRKLEQTFKRKDGTTYSKVVSPEVAEKVIKELIEVYPWDVPIKVEPIKHAVDEKRANEIDALKESVSDLMNVIAEINDRLDKIK